MLKILGYTFNMNKNSLVIIIISMMIITLLWISRDQPSSEDSPSTSIEVMEEVSEDPTSKEDELRF